MKRTLVVVAAVVGFATAASAATLSVTVLNSSLLPQSAFFTGDQIVLRVVGDSQGGSTNAIQGYLTYDASITSFVSATQSSMYANADNLNGLAQDGLGPFMGQNSGAANPSAPSSPTITSFVTLTADAVGSSVVQFGGETLSFFDIYFSAGGLPQSADAFGGLPASFTINVIPEPATAALVGLGLLGLALGGRRRA